MTESSHSSFVRGLAAVLRPKVDGTPVRRIVDHVWESVIEGGLETGQRLPTARELAVALGVSPRTIERAYKELERLGVVSARAGQGTFVSLDAPNAAARDRYKRLEAIAREAVQETEALGFSRFDLTDAIAELPAASDPDEEAADS